jgi:hypothetical protein
VQLYATLSKGIILAGAVAASLALYFMLSLYVFPQSYQLEPRRPEAIVTNVSMSASQIKLGESFVVSVTGANRGEEADMQIVSISFPNLTRTDDLEVLKHNFAQTPQRLGVGKQVGSEYTGLEKPVDVQYPSVEASSRPWPSGSAYSIDLQVRPETEGTFAVFIKAIAFPHSWNGAHWPQEGISDYQKEFVKVYRINVAKP